MPKVIGEASQPLDSEYTLEEHEGVFGLILESWGPSHRNREYNTALDTILSRLVGIGAPFIHVNVISRPLMKRFPELFDRAIMVDGKRYIDLHRTSPKALRKEIGREQAQLKEAPTDSAGNRTKRILVHNPLIDRELWKSVAGGTAILGSFRTRVTERTANRELLEARVDALLHEELPHPMGNATPKKSVLTSEAFERDPAVRAWVLRAAKGICELCLGEAPFVKEDGVPYLEVHHLRPLAEGGKDITENTVALCPNCHRRMHYGAERLALRAELFERIERLTRDIFS